MKYKKNTSTDKDIKFKTIILPWTIGTRPSISASNASCFLKEFWALSKSREGQPDDITCFFSERSNRYFTSSINTKRLMTTLNLTVLNDKDNEYQNRTELNDDRLDN